MSRRTINRAVRNIRRTAKLQRLSALQNNQRTIVFELADSEDDLDYLLSCNEGENPDESETSTRARLEAALREYRAKNP